MVIGGIGSDSLERLLEIASNYISVIRRFSASKNLRLADFGSGVGIPGLLISYLDAHFNVILVDAMKRRADLAATYIDLLGINDRCRVVNTRVEELDKVVYRFDVVVARCFSRTSIFAELATPLLEVGGSMLLTSPHDDYDVRWPSVGLKRFGFAPAELITEGGDNFALIKKVGPSTIAPRSYSKIVKSPLW